MGFKEKKQGQLKKQDKSTKGEIDKDIKKLVQIINKKPAYYTTSSCSGRIVLIKASEKKQPNLFFYISHKKITCQEFKKQLKKASKAYHRLIYFKLRPSLVVVACKDMITCQNLINKAKLAGFKNSGIIATQKRIIAELISTEHLALPIVDKGKILVQESYLKILLKDANKKLGQTKEKIKRFEKLI